MKYPLIFLSAIAFTVPSVTVVDSNLPVIAQNPDASRVNVIAKATTVLVQGQNPGSGVLIDHNDQTYTVLTAKHVVETEDEYEVVTPDGQSYPLQNPKIKRLANLDLALLSFQSDRSYQTADLGLKPTVQEGDRIFVAGWPIAGQAIPHIYQMTSGEISGVSPRTLAGGYQIIYTNVTREGMSGGPIFNTQGKLIGIHGQAEGREILLSDTRDSARVKAGFNLGIPIQQFVQANSGSFSSTPTLATRPPSGPLTESVPSSPTNVQPPLEQESPITLALNPNPTSRFLQPPKLLKSTTTEKTTNQLGARYFFTIEIPENAGASLEQLDFKLNLGVDFPRFSTQATQVFRGQSKSGQTIPVKMLVSDPASRTVTVTMAEPIPPGETVTVMLKVVKNPTIGTYLYEIRGHAADSQGTGQYVGIGRIEIRPVIKF